MSSTPEENIRIPSLGEHSKNKVGVDAGGSLTKVSIFESGKIISSCFPPSDILSAVSWARERKANAELEFVITGGRADTLARLLISLQIKFRHLDEMDSLICGLVYLQKSLGENNDERAILVNVGSGISILSCTKINGGFLSQRITGSSLGGGTFLGAISGMLRCKLSYNDAVELAKNGDNAKVDLLVKDICGTDYDKVHLPGSAIASSLAKLADAEICPHNVDIARSIAELICLNLAQLACMAAKGEGIHRVYITGGFVLDHFIQNLIHSGIEFWSEGRVRSFFLEGGEYIGSIGALVSRVAPVVIGPGSPNDPIPV